MTTKVDLAKLAENSNLQVSIQSIQQEDPAEAKIRRVNDDKRWSTGILSSLVSAFIGFITGRNLSA